MNNDSTPKTPSEALVKSFEEPLNPNIFDLPKHSNDENREAVKKQFQAYNESLGYRQYVALGLLICVVIACGVIGWLSNTPGLGVGSAWFWGCGFSLYFVILLAIYYIKQARKKGSGDDFLMLVQGSMTRVWVTCFFAFVVPAVLGVAVDLILG